MEQRLSSLPDPLTGFQGRTVSTREQWLAERRDEILEYFKENVYGKVPSAHVLSMRSELISAEKGMDGRAVRKKVLITYEGPGGTGTLPFVLFVPTARDSVRVPAFLFMNNRGLAAADPDRKRRSGFWPAERIIERGYAAAVFQVEDVDPDEHDGFRNGVHGIIDPPGEARPKNAWGTIAAWAWGAQRVMDALEQDPEIDAGKVALVGHSRCGKTALWAAAQDERFAMVVSNNSGCTGAAVSRGKQGETIRDINEVFPHWFAENYKRFNDNVDELAVDQHMLLGLIAPRFLYVASASEDRWADPESEFLSVVAAERVYRLFGHDGLGTRRFPPADSPIFGDRIGYHLRTGKHDLTEYDWERFMDFADEKLRTRGSAK